MESYIRNLFVSMSKVGRTQIQLFVLILTLILFVLGAGAPGCWGGFGG
jgi:hypothetical protein